MVALLVTTRDRSMATADRILEVLDASCDSFTFPMLNNGYVYLAATRMSLHRSADDWGLVIEVFGFSPRAGLPDISVHSFGSRLHDRDPAENYSSREAYEQYLAVNPHNELRSAYPIEEGTWQDPDNSEVVAEDARELVLRGRPVALPRIDEYARCGIELENPPQVEVFELCRWLAHVARADVLATARERRISMRPDMAELLVLEHWNHPNVVEEAERPSTSETFRQLARVLETGDVSLYRPTLDPNTHWENWPDGGTL